MCVSSQLHRADDLYRFSEGFFLKNMEQLLSREDFHRLLFRASGQEQFCTRTGKWYSLGLDQNQAGLLKNLEAALINRLYTLHTSCRE